MIIDSSAILAIAFLEPEALRFAAAILESDRRQMSALNWLETMMVVEAGFGPSAADDTLLMLQQLTIGIVAFDATHMQEALEAWRRYGKGRHPAALNLGDCCAYAASKIEDEPLLYKGIDFEKTDVVKAAW
ncbi:MAG TPA: type II toxin-antitoxin system VapC family toxin [Bryobacteraceae bacterium]|jgi:ribonuclease VapC|nr:type II toxin-antitoxin system VapC family toxin [Bryobacteraceae bacterium]